MLDYLYCINYMKKEIIYEMHVPLHLIPTVLDTDNIVNQYISMNVMYNVVHLKRAKKNCIVMNCP